MSKQRFYILRICAPVFLFPFLPTTRDQFIFESECGQDSISFYMVIDKNKEEKSLLFYGYSPAIKKCKYLNENEINNAKKEQEQEQEQEQVKINIKLLENSNYYINRHSIEEKNALYNSIEGIVKDEYSFLIEMEYYAKLTIEDLNFHIENDQNKIIPLDIKERNEYLKPHADVIFSHRNNLIEDIKKITKTHEMNKENTNQMTI